MRPTDVRMCSSGGGGWTPSARPEPGRLLGSPSRRVFHPGHVTINSPRNCLSLARPQQLQQLAAPGFMAPTVPEALIASEKTTD